MNTPRTLIRDLILKTVSMTATEWADSIIAELKAHGYEIVRRTPDRSKR